MRRVLFRRSAVKIRMTLSLGLGLGSAAGIARRRNPHPGIAELERRSEIPLRWIGSLTLVGNMMRLGLVDRLRIMVFPVTLGDAGREPFSAGHPRAGLDLVATEVLDSRLVMLDYRPAGRPVSDQVPHVVPWLIAHRPAEPHRRRALAACRKERGAGIDLTPMPTSIEPVLLLRFTCAVT